MEDLQNKIIELMDLFDGEVTTADKIPQPTPRQEVVEIDAVNEFIKRNPRADGGMLVQPSADGSRPGYKGTFEEVANRRSALAEDYKKIVDYALNNRKIANFPDPVEVIVKGKKTKINYVPTVVEWAKMNGVERGIFNTRDGSLIPIKREQVYKKIVDDTIKLNNQTFTFSVPADIAMDIGITKNQGRGSGVENLLKKGNVTKLLSKKELLSNYIKYLIDNDAPLKDLTNENIFKHINSRRVDKIKLTPDRNKQTTFADSKRTIGFNNISKTMKEQYPDLFAKIGRGGEIPFLSRTIQNKSNLGNLRLSEAFQKTESGDIYFNLIKSQNLNVRKQIAGLVSETDILQGKLKLDQKSLAISNAQDKMIKDLNKYVLNKPEVILNNPSFRQLASIRFENGKFIVDDNPQVINERLQRYINNGFFSTDHKVSKRTGKLNIEFPTNKQIVPTFINGPIKSMEDYITNNISKYNLNTEEGRIIKNNINEIVNVAKTNNFTVNVPKGYSSIFGTNRTNIGAVGDIATVSADGSVLKSYDDQLKRFNLNIDNIPELSNTKVIDYTSVDKSKIAQTLDTKMKTLESLRVSDLDQPQLEKVLASFGDGSCAVQFGPKKRDGGRIGYSSGPASLDDCIKSGVKNFKEGKFKTADQAMEAARLLGGGRNVLRAITKYGIFPEAAFVAGESIFRTVLGEKPLDAIKKSIDSLTFGATDFGSSIDAEKFGKDADLKLAVDKFKESQAKVNKLEKQIAGLEQIDSASKSGYGVDNSEIMRMTKEKLEAAKKELEQNYVNPDIVQYIDRKAENIADAQEATSLLAKRRFDEKMKLSPTNILRERGTSQMDLNLNMLPNFRDYMQSEQAQKDKIFMNAPDEVIKNVVGEEGIEYKKQLIDAYKMENLKNKFGAEQMYGASGIAATPIDLDMSNLTEPTSSRYEGFNPRFNTYKPMAKGGRAGFKGGSKKSNYYSQIKEMLKHYNRYKYMPRSEGQKKPKKIIPLNIFAQEFYKENLASGGLAGIKSGPPPESGPNPQGLSGLLKRGKNI
jgi:hypothetical protein